MTLGVGPADAARQRLARHYLAELRAASAAFRGGHDHRAYGLALFDREWPQIKHWQAWLAAHSPREAEAARLCAHYPSAGADLLALRQTPPERIAWLQAGRQAACSIGDRRAEAACLLLLAWALHKQAAIQAAEAAAREALALAQDLGDPVTTGRSLHLLGEIAVRRGQFDEAGRLHHRSLDLLRAAGAHAYLADVYFSLSELAYLQGDFAAARDFAWQSHTTLEALGLSPTTNNNLTWLGVTTAETGDLDAAEHYVRQSVALCRATGAQSTLAHALYVLSGLARSKHDDALADATIRESLQIAGSIGEEWLIPYLLLQRAKGSHQTGQTAAALADVDQALAIVRQSGYRLALATALVQRADLLWALGQAGAARAPLREGLDLALATQLAMETLYGVLVAARLWRQRGQASQAAEWVGLLESRPGLDLATRRETAALGQALAAELGPADYAAAYERGRALALDAAVAAILAELEQT